MISKRINRELQRFSTTLCQYRQIETNMQKLIVISALLILITGCKKEKLDYRTFAGTWELAKTTGLAGVLEYPAGNGNILLLDNKGHFERKENSEIVYSGTYRLERKGDCGSDDKFWYFITEDSNFTSSMRISIEEGQLVLTTPCIVADGGATIYRRLE